MASLYQCPLSALVAATEASRLLSFATSLTELGQATQQVANKDLAKISSPRDRIKPVTSVISCGLSHLKIKINCRIIFVLYSFLKENQINILGRNQVKNQPVEMIWACSYFLYTSTLQVKFVRREEDT